MNKDLIYPYLDDLQERINEKEEESVFCDWKNYADCKANTFPFLPTKRTASQPKIEWKKVTINDALKDENDMIIEQFMQCSKLLESGSDKIMQVRPNYGVGILPSLYNVELFIMPDETNTLPNVYPFKNGIEDIKVMVQSEMPSFSNGYGEKVFTFAENVSKIFDDFPLLKKYIFLEHPDCQGPMDVCELLWGSELFADLYDEPELAHQALEKISETYEEFLDKWFKTINRPMGYHSFFGKLHKGNIMVRDDSAMNMSGDFYNEFIGPYNERVLKKFDGGGIHFCGTGQHFIEQMSNIEKLYAVDLSQPHLNDMSFILEHTINKNINLFVSKGEFQKELDGNKHNLKYLFV